MTPYRYTRFIMHAFIMATTLRATQAQCSETLTAAAALGATAEFKICQTAPFGDIIGFQSLTTTINVNVPRESLTEGWYWDTSGSGPDSAIFVSFTVDSAEDYDTYTVAFTNTAGVYLNDITVSHQASHAACVEKLEAAAVVGGTVSFYICRTPFSGINIITVYDGPDTTTAGRVITEQTWNDGWYWERGIDFFNISHLVDALGATYTIGYNYDDGTIGTAIVNVYDQAAPQLCMDENGDPLDHLPYTVTTDVGNSMTSTLCILSLDESGTFHVSQPVRVSDEIEPGSSNTFTVSDQAKSGSYFERELMFDVTATDVAGVGNWTINVMNGVGSFTVVVTIQTTGTSMFCQRETDPQVVYVQVGESFTNSVCVLIPGGQSPRIDLTKSDDTGQNYSLVVEASSDNGLSYDVTLSSEAVLEGDFGLWIVDVVSVVDGGKYSWPFNFTLLKKEILTTPITVTNPEDQSSSVSRIAIYVGLASLLNIIVAVVVVVLVVVVRRNKGLKKRTQESGGNIPNDYTLLGASGRDEPSTYQNIHLNRIERRQQSSRTFLFETFHNSDVDSTQNGSGSVEETPGGEYVSLDNENPTSQGKSDHDDATSGEYVTADGDLRPSNRGDHNLPLTSLYETVSPDFAFVRATRTISGTTSISDSDGPRMIPET